MKREEIIRILEELIIKYLDKRDSDSTILELITKLDCEQIYSISNDLIITDCYFAIKHLNEDGFQTQDVELKYFLDCFQGKKQYNLSDKNFILEQRSKNSINVQNTNLILGNKGY